VHDTNLDPSSITLSFVVATFNSERHLDDLSRSINASAGSSGLGFEILAVDGGSTDETLRVARELKMRVLENPNGNAIAAKHLGLWAARGRYVCFMDHDERFHNVKTVERAIRTFKTQSHIRAIMTSGYILSRAESGSNWYASEFGDPVSLFLYRFPNRFGVRETTFVSKFCSSRDSEFTAIVKCSEQQGPVLCELVAAASFVDAEFFRTTFGAELQDPNNIPHLFYLLGNDDEREDEVGLLKDCPIRHESVSSWRQVCSKVRWRIGNAVIDQEGIRPSGLTGRWELEQQSGKVSLAKLKLKHSKFRFLIYAVTLVGPFIDALALSLRRRRVGYLMHLPLTLYVVYTALVMKAKSILGIRAPIRRYDGTLS
jgi:glycosyltransferase involved in cell wall biosynthesis